MYESFDKAFEDFRRKAESYKKRELAGDINEGRQLDRFVTSGSDKWRKLSNEIRYAQPILEEMIGNWRRYNQNYKSLKEWLPEAERAVTMPLDDRQSFFSDLSSWTDRQKSLNQAGNFLIENCVEEVSVDVKNTLLTINRRWKDLLDEVSVGIGPGKWNLENLRRSSC